MCGALRQVFLSVAGPRFLLDSTTGVVSGDLRPSSTSYCCNTSSASCDSIRSLALMSARSEEHTSELQSPCNLVCRLLLEKKKKNKYILLDWQSTRMNSCHLVTSYAVLCLTK